MDQVYPGHIYDRIRRQVAVSYVQHELKKYLPSLRSGVSWKTIDGDVGKWFDQSPFVLPVRDFWNGVYGIVTGFKLLIHLVDFFTAENIIWERREIDARELNFAGFNPNSFGVKLENTKVSEAVNFYNDPQNRGLRADHLQKVRETFGKTFERESDPIIVVAKKVDKSDQTVVYDGNARVFLSILQNKTIVPAFVSSFGDDDRKLRNYWIPTGMLQELAHYARQAEKENNIDLYKAHTTVLKHILGHSESAVYEMRERVLPEGEFRKKLLADLGLAS